MICRNETRDIVLANKVKLADSFLARLKGLLFTNKLPDGNALYIRPCQGIHMFFMLYAIDVVFVDDKGIVVGLVESIGPFQVSKIYKTAKACIELPSGKIRETFTNIGDRLVLQD